MIQNFQEVMGSLFSKDIQRNADALNLQNVQCNREDYAQLPYSKVDDQNVETVLAKMSVFSLMPWKIPKEASELIALGRQMGHLHPFRFLEGCVDTPSRVGYIQEILKTNFVGYLFIQDLAKRFSAHQTAGNLIKYWPDFLERIHSKVRMEQRELSPWVEGKNVDWRGFLNKIFSHL